MVRREDVSLTPHPTRGYKPLKDCNSPHFLQKSRNRLVRSKLPNTPPPYRVAVGLPRTLSGKPAPPLFHNICSSCVDIVILTFLYYYYCCCAYNCYYNRLVSTTGEPMFVGLVGHLRNTFYLDTLGFCCALNTKVIHFKPTGWTRDGVPRQESSRDPTGGHVTGRPPRRAHDTIRGRCVAGRPPAKF